MAVVARVCKKKACNKLLLYEVQGWSEDKLACDWDTKYHVNQSGPGFKALKRWEAEGKKNARKIVY